MGESNQNNEKEDAVSVRVDTNVSTPVVCLAWATRKRHIIVDRKVLCESKSKHAGYSVANGQYNSLAMHGIPDYEKDTDDRDFCHSDGIIEYKPFDKQSLKINTRSVCSKCLKKYNKLLGVC